MLEERFENGFGFGGKGGLSKGVVHEKNPAVARPLIHGKGVMADPKTWMTALFDVDGRPSEAEDEEIAQALFGPRQVGGRIHGAEDIVAGDLAVEGGDEPAKTVVTD